MGKHSSGGNLTGLTLTDYIMLPARARISISYSSGSKTDLVLKGSEGFLGLRKL